MKYIFSKRILLYFTHMLNLKSKSINEVKADFIFCFV